MTANYLSYRVEKTNIENLEQTPKIDFVKMTKGRLIQELQRQMEQNATQAQKILDLEKQVQESTFALIEANKALCQSNLALSASFLEKPL